MRKILFTIIVGSFFIVAPALAADYYVDGDNGSATGIGTTADPFLSITQALAVISGGDTIYCQGTIYDNPSIPSSVAGSASGYTTISARPDYVATIDGGGAGHNSVFTVQPGADYITISGLNITNANHSGISSLSFNATDHLQITNNAIYDLVDGANATYIYLYQTPDTLISGNHVYGHGDDLIGILVSESPNLEISANRIHDFESNGVIIYNGSYDSILKNNQIYNIGGSAGLGRGAVYAYDTYNLKIYNNVFFNIQDETNIVPAIQVAEGSLDSHDVAIRNNIFSSVDLGFVVDENSISGSSSDYNIFYSVTYFGSIAGVGFLTFEQWQTYAYQDANGHEANPLFVSTDPLNYDFHVQAASPAIDHGEDLPEVLIDYDGEERPYNITDIGSDEMAVVLAPENLVASPHVSSADFSWAMPGAYTATYYKIKVCTDPALTTAAEFTTTEPTYNLTGMSSAGTYYFAVQAYYETDYQIYYSDYSESVKFFNYPKKVKEVKVPKKFIKATQVKAKWKLQNNVTGYRIFVMNKKGNKITTVNVKTNINHRIIKRLKPDHVYKIKIKAKVKVDSTVHWGAWSKIKRFTTKSI